MGSRNRLSVARPCCGESACRISDGWLCDVKDNLVSADITDFSIDSGTWNGVDYWNTGSTNANGLETTSSNARITCDSTQSPANDRLRAVFAAHLEDEDNDQVQVVMAGETITLGKSGVTIGSLAACSFPYTGGPFTVCSWYDSDTGLEYIGVQYEETVSNFGFYKPVALVAKTTLGTSGTMSFGTGSVSGKVTFWHSTYNPRYCATFWDNDGDCRVCYPEECDGCPDGDAPQYLSVQISGAGGQGTDENCDCSSLDGTYVKEIGFTQDTYGSDGCSEHHLKRYDVDGREYMCYGVIGTYISEEAYNIVDVYVVILSSIGKSFEDDGSWAGKWQVQVIVSEFWYFNDGPFIGTSLLADEAHYNKEYTSSELCTDIDDDLTIWSHIQWIQGNNNIPYCNVGGLTVHVTASG